MVAQFGRSFAMAWVASKVSLMMGTLPMMVFGLGEAPPCDELEREAAQWQGNDVTLSLGGGRGKAATGALLRVFY
jgi:hypothetical protein